MEAALGTQVVRWGPGGRKDPCLLGSTCPLGVLRAAVGCALP